LVVFLIPFFFGDCKVTEDHSTATDRPNILLILADDMGFGDVGLAGNPYLNTPHLDRLALSGVRFSHFYVSPVCAPTRASLLTGRYHQRTRVRSVTNGYETMDPEEITLAEYLKPAGYRTGIFGKWHLGEYYPSLPNAQGFDEYLGFRTGHTDDYYDPVLEHNGQMEQKEGYLTEVLTEEAIRFMSADPTAPFFCYLPYNAPHTPLQVDSSWWQPYSERGLDERTARVYGMIAQIDENIGRLLDFLENNELRENTIVIFMSDNGPINGWRVPQEEMRYNAGLRDQKFTIFEGGIRTQAFWSWPGQWPAEVETSTIGAHIDVVPTIIDLLGLSSPIMSDMQDGISLAPVLRGEDTDNNERTYFEHYDLGNLAAPEAFPGGIARHGPWKMVSGNELYHLGDDPGESRNLSDSLPDQLAELKTAYLNWWEDIVATSNFNIAPIPVSQTAGAVHLQPHHARAGGGLQFMGHRGLLGEKKGTHPSGVDGDWLSNWQSTEDEATWRVNLWEDGNFAFDLYARRPQAATPLELLLSLGEQSMPINLPANWENSEWTTFRIGTQNLKAGTYPLRLQMTGDVPGSTFELRELIITPQ
jgi:arylsulfatase A